MKGTVLCYISLLIVISAMSSGCFKSQPPAKPVLSGPDCANVGDTVFISIYSVDPEDNVITYFIEWGDTTAPQWSPFFHSGDTIERSHIYSQVGIYFIRAKARDINRSESDWSDSLRMRIEP